MGLVEVHQHDTIEEIKRTSIHAVRVHIWLKFWRLRWWIDWGCYLRNKESMYVCTYIVLQRKHACVHMYGIINLFIYFHLFELIMVTCLKKKERETTIYILYTYIPG